jgi:predicted naringenin-chalcone synthase
MKGAYIGALATAIPACRIGQKSAGEFLKKNYSGRLSPKGLSVLEKIFAHPSIEERSFAFKAPSALLEEDADARIKRFTESAVMLSSEAVKKTLYKGGIKKEDITAIIVNTCTGYLCPGLSTHLIEELSLRRDVKAFDLVGGGCGGAVPNIELAANLVRECGGAALSVSVEICSATFQMEDDLSLILSNALFADGAAACLIRERPKGLQIMHSESRHAPEHRDAIRYVYKKGELHNRLSVTLPRLIREEAGALVREVFEKNPVKRKSIKHWALHPGGAKILDAVKEELGLLEHELAPARKVLREYGNMSSPTVLFVLDEILRNGMNEGEHCFLLTFGAGLSAHGMILRKR